MARSDKKPPLPQKPCERCGIMIVKKEYESNNYFSKKRFCGRSCSSYSRTHKKKEKKPVVEPVKIINTALYFRAI